MLTLPRGSKIARSRALALQWVKGFHAADPARISEHALAEGGSPHDDVREQRLGRAINGYDAVPQWIGRDVLDRVRFGSVVTRIQWEPGGVRVEIRQPNGESMSAVEARAAIVTLPLGVFARSLASPGSVIFDPPLDAIEEKSAALAGMEMGAVLRVILHLREPFWASTEQFARRAKNQRSRSPGPFSTRQIQTFRSGGRATQCGRQRSSLGVAGRRLESSAP